MIQRVTVHEFARDPHCEALWNRKVYPHITRVSTGEQVHGVSTDPDRFTKGIRYWLALFPTGTMGEHTQVAGSELLDVTIDD